MINKPEDVEKAKRISPALRELTRKLEAEGLQYSALIFNPDGEFLIRAGNSEHRGADFVRMHYYLALVIAQLDQMGLQSDLSVVEQMASPSGKDPAEIALRMAQCVLMVPTELVPDRIRTLATEYLDAVGA